MSNRITIKTCEFCGKSYQAKKCDSKYCSPTCRKYAYIERESEIRGWVMPDTYTSYKRKPAKEPASRITESGSGSEVQNLLVKELVKFLKSKGHS